VYTFEGRADQRVVATDGDASNTNGFEFFAFLYGPDRQPLDDGYSLFSGQPITLPSDGTYKLVIFPTTTDGSVTLWDVRHAPAGAVRPDDFGMPDDIRSCLQADSATSATTATTGAALCLRTLPSPDGKDQNFGPAAPAP
jgi:hypothetical protein